MNCLTGEYIQHQSKNKPYHMKERLISYQLRVLDWFICVRSDHTFPCCTVVKDVNVFHVGIFCLEFRRRISRNWLALNNGCTKNIIMTTDKRWKVNLFLHIHGDSVRFHPTIQSCKDLRQVAKFCDRLNPMFQTYNWHTESTTIIQSIAFLR